MDAARALADLQEISAQIREAALAGLDGGLIGGSERVARAARELLEAAQAVRPDGQVTQVEAATTDGSLFVLREGERIAAATTIPEPTVGLVFYDLKATLRAADEAPEPEPAQPSARARRPRRSAEDGAA